MHAITMRMESDGKGCAFGGVDVYSTKEKRLKRKSGKMREKNAEKCKAKEKTRPQTVCKDCKVICHGFVKSKKSATCRKTAISDQVFESLI